MRKYIVLLLLATLAGCSAQNSDENTKAIEEAVQQGKIEIEKYTNQKIEDAKKEISDKVSVVISQADTTLTKKFQEVESSLNAKAKETHEKINSELKTTNSNIKFAKEISIAGCIIGLIGIILAIIAYKKKPRTDIDKVTQIIKEQNLSNNSKIENPFTNKFQQQKDIERAIERYLSNRKFNMEASAVVMNQPSTKDVKDIHKFNAPSNTNSNNDNQVVNNTHILFARDSRTLTLSNIHDSYQKGKSIYKLILDTPSATTANLSICIEQEEVKLRIFERDNDYLEPICEVTRSSGTPTQVLIKNTGIAERDGDDWKVTRKISVEIK